MKRISTLRLPESTYEVIKDYATKRDMKVLHFVRYILDNWAKKHKSKIDSLT